MGIQKSIHCSFENPYILTGNEVAQRKHLRIRNSPHVDSISPQIFLTFISEFSCHEGHENPEACQSRSNEAHELYFSMSFPFRLKTRNFEIEFEFIIEIFFTSDYLEASFIDFAMIKKRTLVGFFLILILACLKRIY
jgi:hypothetical protein